MASGGTTVDEANSAPFVKVIEMERLLYFWLELYPSPGLGGAMWRTGRAFGSSTVS